MVTRPKRQKGKPILSANKTKLPDGSKTVGFNLSTFVTNACIWLR